jgi:signal transduction histidine kinase/ligand-binding sensor domain-containing protein
MTFGGLSVYDGVRFKNYTTQNGMISDMVNDILEIGSDSLLVAINSCGMNILANGVMKRYDLSGDTCPIVNQFLKGQDGFIYLGADEGLYRLKENRIEKLSTFYPSTQEPVRYLATIAAYKDFIIFSINDLRHFTGLFLFNKKEGKITDALEKLFVLNVVTDHRGVIWASTSGSMQVLDTVALGSGKLQLIKPYRSSRYQQPMPPGHILFNPENEPFIVANNKVILQFANDGRAIPIASPDSSVSNLQNIFIDREKILWICQDGNGVYKLPGTKLQSNIELLLGNRSGIKEAAVFSHNSFCIAMNDGQWILSNLSGIQRYMVPATFKALPLQFTNTQLYAIDDHNLYLATLTQKTRKILQFKKIFSVRDSSSFADKSVFDPYGNIILSEKGNILVFQKDKLIYTFRFSSFGLIEGMHINKKGQLWTVSRDSRLMILSLHPEDPLHYLQMEDQFVHEFGSASPRCMTVDKDELLWVGTRFNGLYAFEYKNKQLHQLYHFQTGNGLTDNFVTTLACDSDNNMIIGTQTGLDRLVKMKEGGYRVENITKSNNVFSYITPVWTDRLNNVYALTTTGIIYKAEPVRSEKNVPDPHLLIEEMKVNGNLVSDVTVPLNLEYYQRNISFSIAAPTFIDERQVKYSYMLEGGGNSTWSDALSLADISLLNLSPGKYTFRAKAFFPSTSYAPAELAYPFEIVPPWWQTTFFRLITASLIMALLIAGVRYYYMRKLIVERRHLEKQQAIEQERNRIAADMHDDLGAGLTKIKYITEDILEKTGSGETILPELEKLKNFSSELIESMGEIIWAVSEKNNLLSNTLYYLRSYAVNYCEENNLDCHFEVPDNFKDRIVTGNIRRNIFLLLKESLHNIVKHANAKRVTIKAAVKEKLELVIKDDGNGFFDNGDLKGNGLINMKKRVKELNGSIFFETNRGASVVINLPFNPNQSTIG